MSGTDSSSLFLEHRAGVFRYLRRAVGDPSAAQDLTQEVFLRVVRVGPSSQDPGGLRSWIFTIARHVAINHMRNSRRRPFDSALGEVDLPSRLGVQELSVAIERALASLGDLDRDVFLLREAGGLTYNEIAATCSLTTEAVRARLHRARNSLRSDLDVWIHSRRRCRRIGLSGSERGG